MGKHAKKNRRCDITIIGGGLVGSSLALALARFAPQGFRVALIDAAPPQRRGNKNNDARALALSAATRKFLETLGLWAELAPNAQPICSIEITDSPLEAHFRPHLLGFDDELAADGPRAHMVETRHLTSVLAAAVAEEETIRIFAPARLSGFESDAFGVAVGLEPGEETETKLLKTSLLVAADGKSSRVRDLAGIKCVGWSYPQIGIVTTVAHANPHNGKAVQHFLPAGPFAILPLTSNRSSIVWTEDAERGAAIMAMDENDFAAELATRFGHRLGDIEVVGPRQSFPLDFSLARSFVGDRLALVGDAAHVVHPLAGQGLNIGMRDVAALAEAIVDAARLGLDIGSAAVLERYQRWRRFDSAFSAVVMDGLNRLFSNDRAPVRALRDAGLGLVERAPALKRFLVSEAAGASGTVPRLLRGEKI
jgi:2-octaprenyl-6-methoxyphenol hydroxylase